MGAPRSSSCCKGGISRRPLALLLLVAVAVNGYVMRVPSTAPWRLPIVALRTSSSSVPGPSMPGRSPLPSRWRQQQRPRAPFRAAVGSGGVDSSSNNNDLREKVLATVRSLYFPLTVLGAGLLGAWRPAVYGGLSEGFVTRALAAVMVRGACIHTSVDDAPSCHVASLIRPPSPSYALARPHTGPDGRHSESR